MKKMIRNQSKMYLFCCLIAVSVACSDNSSSPSVEDCTSLPNEITPATLSTEYFINQNVPVGEEYTNYRVVESAALGGLSTMQAAGFANLAESFLVYAQFTGASPEIDGSSCSWTISFSDDMFTSKEPGIESGYNRFILSNNDQFSIRVNATPGSGGIQWEIFITGNFEGDTVNDFRLITGFTSENKNTGEWNFYLPESANSPVYTYQWEMLSDTEFESSATFIDGNEIATVEYEKNGAENWMTYSYGTETVSVFWNESNNSGWFEADGERCEYQNFINTGCS